MIQYRKILELHFNDVSQRTISTSVGSSRNTVSDITKRAKKLGLERLTDNMNNHWLEELLFPEKQAIEKGFFPPNWEKVHKVNTALGIVHQCGTFVHRMRVKSPPSAIIIVQIDNLLYTYFMYEFSYK
ncbi:hypothetical protein QNK01_10860 [Desemzia incerta]|uniref:hypothetical protein n=1 Tax=Desemzia incerta TaxID=82801 RepID=UPI0024C244B8|nr:hypothetical protein [Desemzia incerta]WHZ31935.1 hypothetical protein QNK01_10860 [Desemzia incerta]